MTFLCGSLAHAIRLQESSTKETSLSLRQKRRRKL